MGNIFNMQCAEREMSSLVSAELDSSISSASGSSSDQLKYRMKLSQMSDKRVVVVPVVYMLLKFWGIAVDIGIYFVSTHARTTYRQNAFSSVLVFLSVSVLTRKSAYRTCENCSHKSVHLK